jgi:hypothetical protein
MTNLTNVYTTYKANLAIQVDSNRSIGTWFLQEPFGKTEFTTMEHQRTMVWDREESRKK